jgi:hypothetical protein
LMVRQGLTIVLHRLHAAGSLQLLMLRQVGALNAPFLLRLHATMVTALDWTPRAAGCLAGLLETTTRFCSYCSESH